MAATVEICESNTSSETISHNITNSNMGSVDDSDLVAATYPIAPGDRSYAKYQRVHVTAMGGSSKVNNLQVWRTGALGGSATHVTNARTSSYGGAETFAEPTDEAISGVDQTMPTSDPGAANLGIGGSLTGEITEAGYSDYLIHQIVTDAGDTSGATATLNFQYDEIA